MLLEEVKGHLRRASRLREYLLLFGWYVFAVFLADLKGVDYVRKVGRMGEELSLCLGSLMWREILGD